MTLIGQSLLQYIIMIVNIFEIAFSKEMRMPIVIDSLPTCLKEQIKVVSVHRIHIQCHFSQNFYHGRPANLETSVQQMPMMTE